MELTEALKVVGEPPISAEDVGSTIWKRPEHDDLAMYTLTKFDESGGSLNVKVMKEGESKEKWANSKHYQLSKPSAIQRTAALKSDETRKAAKAKKGGKVARDMEEEAKQIKSAWIEVAAKIFTIIATIISIVSVSKANSVLSAASDDYNQLISNWEKVPIVDVEAVTFVSGGGACSSNYSEMTTLNWEGDQSAGCGCPANSKYSSKSFRSCNSSETSSGCRTDKDMLMEEVPYRNWRGKTLCIKRAGDPAVIDFTAYGSGLGDGTENAEIRPIPDKNGICKTGYKKCGSGNSFDNDYAVCVPDDGTLCPITLLGSPGGDDWTASENSGAGWSTTLNLTGTNILDTNQPVNENSVLNVDREMTKVTKTTYTGLPIVDIRMAFSSNNRGPCYGDPSDQSRYKDQAKFGSNMRADFNRPSDCARTDGRWFLVDTLDESRVMADVLFGANAPSNSDCANKDILEASAYDYFTASGTPQCVNSGFDTYQQCHQIQGGGSSLSSSCSGGDELCKNAKFQSNCGRLYKYYNDMKNDGYTIGIYAQSQIFWKSDCAIPYSEVFEAQKPINDILDQQKIVVLVTIIASSFILLFAFLSLFRNYELIGERGSYTANTTDYIEERVDLVMAFFALFVTNWFFERGMDIGPFKCSGSAYGPSLFPVRRETHHYPLAQQIHGQQAVHLAFRYSFIFFIVKAIPLCTAISILAPLVPFFKSFDDDQCSDPITNRTFEDLAISLPQAYTDDVTALTMDVLMVVLFPMLTALYHYLYPAEAATDVSSREALAATKAKLDQAQTAYEQKKAAKKAAKVEGGAKKEGDDHSESSDSD